MAEKMNKESTMHTPHPGKDIYPDLSTPLTIKDLGEFESSQIDVRDGKVVFSRWSEDLDDRVSFVISEWDLGIFLDAWAGARVDQRLKRSQ